MTLLLVLIGGAAGAVLRFLLDALLTPRLAASDGLRKIPVATLLANVGGSLLLGFLAGAGSRLPAPLGTLLGTGFCGALTTWSTFAFQSIDQVDRRWAAGYVAATLVLGIGAAALGGALVR